MIVVDASVVIEWLLRLPRRDAAEIVLSANDALEAPHLLLTEVAQTVRRYEARTEISADRAAEAIDDLADLDLHLHAHDMLMNQVWQLRHNLTAYDATYVALATALEVPLVTFDQRLANAVGNAATVIVPD